MGNIWEWITLEPDPKLILSWLVGRRDAQYAKLFLGDIAQRVAGRIELTPDGHKPNLQAVETAFGSRLCENAIRIDVDKNRPLRMRCVQFFRVG
jgi:uncharacterized protein involved in tellurium resistance